LNKEFIGKMQLAKVIGTVVATKKHEALNGIKILMIQPLNDNLKPVSKPIAAVDPVAQAGLNDLVHWVSAREASLTLPDSFAPVDAAITGIVDQVNQEDVGINKEIFEDEQ
jgi:microcompartment protein CcmK/EutM